MRAALKPIRFAEPLRRGCEEEVILVVEEADLLYNDADECIGEETKRVDLTDKKVFLTVKEVVWDNVANDSTAIFKIEGKILEQEAEDVEFENNRVIFTISEHDTYKLIPGKHYYADIIITDADGTSHPKAYGTYTFEVAAGPNNAEAGGLENE